MIVFILNLLIFTNTKEVFLWYVKDKQLINFRQKAINGLDVQNSPWATQEWLAGRMWPSGRTLPRSALGTHLSMLGAGDLRLMNEALLSSPIDQSQNKSMLTCQTQIQRRNHSFPWR